MPEITKRDDAFVVIAEFEVAPDCLGAFLKLACDDARHSVVDEPGCRQFDIIRPEMLPNDVLFYEVYESREAFDAHLTTPHFARFRDGWATLAVTERLVRFGHRPILSPSIREVLDVSDI
jgi:quinol monooxygenase YgiN